MPEGVWVQVPPSPPGVCWFSPEPKRTPFALIRCATCSEGDDRLESPVPGNPPALAVGTPVTEREPGTGSWRYVVLVIRRPAALPYPKLWSGGGFPCTNPPRNPMDGIAQDSHEQPSDPTEPGQGSRQVSFAFANNLRNVRNLMPISTFYILEGVISAWEASAQIQPKR